MLNLWGVEPTRRIRKLAVEESRLGVSLIFSLDVLYGRIVPIAAQPRPSRSPGRIFGRLSARPF
jgi:hypothetical protein